MQCYMPFLAILCLKILHIYTRDSKAICTKAKPFTGCWMRLHISVLRSDNCAQKTAQDRKQEFQPVKLKAVSSRSITIWFTAPQPQSFFPPFGVFAKVISPSHRQLTHESQASLRNCISSLPDWNVILLPLLLIRIVSSTKCCADWPLST